MAGVAGQSHRHAAAAQQEADLLTASVLEKHKDGKNHLDCDQSVTSSWLRGSGHMVQGSTVRHVVAARLVLCQKQSEVCGVKTNDET